MSLLGFKYKDLIEAGCDEAGRGCLAGPVVAAAVILPHNFKCKELDDSKKISEKLGYVLCGGDLSEPTLVSEQYLLDLEREAFLSLCGEKKTLERIQSVITAGRPIRN